MPTAEARTLGQEPQTGPVQPFLQLPAIYAPDQILNVICESHTFSTGTKYGMYVYLNNTGILTTTSYYRKGVRAVLGIKL